ncbi:MAG: DUF4126 domain-containing protein [Xanthomonadales bacterium]|nr:DUF4126 domain-containing protein [Xanthomonadales bacterium]MBP7418391.1 DUF4126 domain-containing protein [Xanthomonadales bacterium]
MDLIPQLALAAGLAWGAGLRLYAVVFLAGIAGRMGWIELPGSLAYLGNDGVLWVAGAFLLLEFLADKIPMVDSAWDALQTFIRIPGAMVLAWGALGEQGEALQFAAALLGGSIAGVTHLGKAGTRAIINHSPEPFSNGIASFFEDGLVIGGLWLAMTHPWVFLVLLALFLALLVWLIPKLWRAFAASLRRLRRQRVAAG